MEDFSITQKEADKIYVKIVSLEVSIKKQQQYINSEDLFFDNQEFMQLMNISLRTAQQWRNNKIISFSQIGSKIYYRLADIQKLLDENYVSKKESQS
jgi:hypothetical protein